MPSTNEPDKPSNGTISERTKIPLKLGIPLVVFVVGCASWVSRVEQRLTSLDRHDTQCDVLLSERRIGDRFRGADADRWFERVQWAWQHYSEQEEGITSYPEVPPWREGTHWVPRIIHIEDK